MLFEVMLASFAFKWILSFRVNPQVDNCATEGNSSYIQFFSPVFSSEAVVGSRW